MWRWLIGGWKAQRQPKVVGVGKLMKRNSTHFASLLLCHTEKKILSVCNLPSKRCGMQTMLEKGAFFCRQIGNKRVFNADLSDKDE
jgi:hypothetical protein